MSCVFAFVSSKHTGYVTVKKIYGMLFLKINNFYYEINANNINQ